MDSEINSQNSDNSYTETYSSLDGNLTASNTFRQYECFSNILFGEESDKNVNYSVSKESEQWINAFPHLRIIGKNIFPVSSEAESREVDSFEEVFAEHHDGDTCESSNKAKSSLVLKSGSIWGSETVILDGYPDDKSESRSNYNYDKDLDNLFEDNYNEGMEPIVPPLENFAPVRDMYEANKFNENYNAQRTTRLSKTQLSPTIGEAVKKSEISSQNKSALKSRHTSREYAGKMSEIETKTLSPLEKRVNKFPYRRVPTVVKSKLSNSGKTEILPIKSKVLVQTVTSKTSFKPTLNSLTPLTRLYGGSVPLNHYSKIPPILSKK